MSDCGKYPYEGPIMNEANWFTNETTKLLAENLAQRSRLDELERENAELREILINADELERYSGSDGRRQWGKCSAWLNPDYVVITVSAKAFDAIRKEAQP